MILKGYSLYSKLTQNEKIIIFYFIALKNIYLGDLKSVVRVTYSFCVVHDCG